MKPEPEIKDIRLMNWRLTPISEFFDEIDKAERYLWQFKYPRLSIMWLIVLILFVWFFDPKYFLTYVLSVVIVLFSLGNKDVAKKMNPILQRIFWDHPNKFLKENLAVKLVSE